MRASNRRERQLRRRAGHGEELLDAMSTETSRRREYDPCHSLGRLLILHQRRPRTPFTAVMVVFEQLKLLDVRQAQYRSRGATFAVLFVTKSPGLILGPTRRAAWKTSTQSLMRQARSQRTASGQTPATMKRGAICHTRAS